jgi:hypothetical protein
MLIIGNKIKYQIEHLSNWLEIKNEDALIFDMNVKDDLGIDLYNDLKSLYDTSFRSYVPEKHLYQWRKNNYNEEN